MNFYKSALMFFSFALLFTGLSFAEVKIKNGTGLYAAVTIATDKFITETQLLDPNEERIFFRDRKEYDGKPIAILVKDNSNKKQLKLEEFSPAVSVDSSFKFVKEGSEYKLIRTK